MKKLLLLSVFAPTLAFALPLAAFASTYDYVNTSGVMQSVVANSADQALALATNIDPHSGVILDTGVVVTTTNSGVVVTTTTGGTMFEYVNTAGILETVSAPDSTTAMALAVNRAPNSGVMKI